MLPGPGPSCAATSSCRRNVEARLAAAAVEGLHQHMAGCASRVHVHGCLLLLDGCLCCRSALQGPGRPRLPQDSCERRLSCMLHLLAAAVHSVRLAASPRAPPCAACCRCTRLHAGQCDRRLLGSKRHSPPHGARHPPPSCCSKASQLQPCAPKAAAVCCLLLRRSSRPLAAACWGCALASAARRLKAIANNRAKVPQPQ